MEKCKHEAMRLLDNEQKQKTSMELLEQYIQFQQGSIVNENKKAPYEEMAMTKKGKYLQEMKVYKKKKKDEEDDDHMKEGEQSMELKNQEAL
ncbi:hypothetical protein H5410_045803 [Solanum commersonii]|uniref:Uncharacterized protein n=1 Tax=Solanum commersonii TaxID=4109 RepID=A0A9J5XAJ2_SOLCO|nr:hypothetical protein H5410_045803 [Solanum commersonii]